MRLPVIAPADFGTEQRQICEAMRIGIEKDFQGLKRIVGKIEPDLFCPVQQRPNPCPPSANPIDLCRKSQG
jgi:hypothetical protein